MSLVSVRFDLVLGKCFFGQRRQNNTDLYPFHLQFFQTTLANRLGPFSCFCVIFYRVSITSVNDKRIHWLIAIVVFVFLFLFV